ncbi:MAG: aminoacyl-tRNA hydrolase [Firmicutes bacterium HGW-Firmicutes-14]|nr:MAG: aminoacyl-tRNA hydrolase [Firmicutes bacterium HGW-Firmicutes-14]
MKLIIGLGNPGKNYAATRHNTGFMTIDYLAEKLGIKTDKLKFKSLIGEGLVNGEKVVLAKPQTFMNLSGEAVFDMISWYKAEPGDILVIYDDMDLPLGKIRLRMKGGPGGHNGMKSIIYMIQTEDFPRLRIGIGRPEDERFESVDYVLGKFNEEEGKIMTTAVKKAADAVVAALETGVEQAMNEVNRE